MKLRLPHALIKALGCVFGVAAATLGTSNSYGAGMHSQVSLVTYTDFGQNMGRYRVNGVNDLLSSIRKEEGGVVITYTEGHADYTLEHYMPSFESQVDSGAFAAVGYNFIATVQHNNCQNPTFTGRYLDGNVSLHYYGVEYRDALTFCLVAQTDDQKHTQDYKLTRMNRVITDVTPSTPATLTQEEILALPGTMEYRSGSGRMFLWSLDGTSTLLKAAYVYAIGGMRRIDSAVLNNQSCPSFFTTTTTMDYSAQGVSESDPLPFAPATGDSGSPVWIWDEDSQSYVYLNAYQSIFNGGLTANARGDLDYTWKVLDKFDKEVGVSGGTVHIKGVVAADGDTEISETTAEHVYTTKLHLGSVVDAQGSTLQQFVGVKGDDDKYIHTWLNLAPEKDNANWFAYDNKYYNVGVYNNVQRELEIQNLFFTENLVFQASAASGNTVAVDADTDLGIGYVQFSIAPESGLGHADFTLQSNGKTSDGHGGQRDFMLNSAGFVVDANVDLHVKLTNTEWDSAAGDYYYREWRKVGEGNLHLEGSGNNEILLNVGGSGTTYLNEQGGYAAYNVYAGSGATVSMESITQIARDFTFGYNGGTLDIRGNNSMDWYRTNPNVGAQGFSINSFSEDAYITNSRAGTTLTLTYREGGDTEYIGSFVDTKDGGVVRITFDAGSGSTTTLHSIHTSLENEGSGITVHSGSVVLSGTHTKHGLGSASGLNADRYLSADDWHYADMAAKVQVDSGAVFELGSHARLTGDVTVNAGGRLVVREGVHSTLEYIEGGLRLEDATTAFYRQFYGLHGNVTAVAGSTVEFAYSNGTAAEQVYGGNLSGGAALTMSLGGSGATLRLSGTNTITGTKSLSGGGLISDNGLLALGSVTDDANAWHVGADAFIAANSATGAQLLPLVKKDSTGVLALTQAQETDLDLGENGYNGLIVGALRGLDVHYGTAGAQLSTVQNGGKAQWLLGGGGGNLIVDFALQDGTAELVLGNEYTTGNVTLTNSSNEIGTISFKGQVTLSYTDEAALGGATVDLNYTNRMQLLSSSGMGGISTASAGVVLVDKLGGAALDMTAHPALYIGAGTAKQLDAAPVIAPGAAYRFGGIDGTLTVNAVLANAGSQPTGLFVDGQTFSGGVLELAQAATITGAVDVRGYDPARMLPTMAQKGDITLLLTAENAIASATSVTMADGGIIDIHGTTQTLNNLGADAGSLVTDSSLSGSGVLNLNNTTGTTFSGVLDVARVNKTGTGTLNLSGTSLVDAYNVQQGTLHVSEPAAVSGIASVQGGATLSLAAGDYGMVAALQDGANLRVADNATVTLGGLALADNATANISGGTLRVTDMETILGNGVTLNLAGGSLALAIDEDLHFTHTLRASGGVSSTVTVAGGNKDTSYTRVFDSISVDADSTLTLEQAVQETSPTYEIHGLSGQGTFIISHGTYKNAPSFYKFNRDTDFEGTLMLVAGTGYGGRAYTGHILIQSDNALANAQVQMKGWSNDNGFLTLGIDTENASIKGLETVDNSRSILMAGATTDTNAQNPPVSTRRATLAITGSGTKDFKGKVVGGADGTDNGLSIVMDGTGTQTFSGESVFNDVSALKGTLRISNSNENTAIKGDLAVARGATLEINKAYTLGSGKTIHVVGASSDGTAALTAPITFSGGTVDFAGGALNAGTAALTLSSTISGSATISFSETSLLQAGVTYKLADGNWSNISLTTANLDYLTANVSATTNGLTATFSLRDDSFIWDGDSAQHAWTATTFGRQTLSFQNTYRAVFTDAAESKDVQVNGSISAASLIIDSTGEYTFGGSGLVTAGSLSQLTSGTTSIGNTVKITGQAHVQAGTLAMLGGSSTGSVLVDEGATLVLKGADATTGSVSGGGALVIDWDSQSGSIPAIGESGIGTLRVASGTLTTGAQLNVKNGTWVEQGATLRSTVGTILPAGQSLHLAGTLELNLAAGSLTTSIAGYDGTRGSVLLNSTDTSTIAANTAVDAETLTVNAGTVSLDKAASLNVGALAVGSAATMQIHRDGNSVRNIGTVQLGASSTLSLYSDTEPSTSMSVDSLVLGGASATVVQDYISGAILFRSLSRMGDSDVTLNLDSTAAYQKISLFEFGGADDTPGDFSGEIALNCTSKSSYNRSAALVLDDANVAAGAVINLKSAYSGNAVLAFGVNAEVVNIAGLASNSALGNRARLFSGSVAPSTLLSDAAFSGSAETHKLVITTASGSAYDFYGRIGRNVDLTVAGDGTQRLLGNAADFSGMLTVQGGSLEIANAPSFGSASEKEGFNATLAGGILALQGGGLNLGSGSLSVTGDTTISLDTAGQYSYHDGSDSENGFSLMTVVSAGTAEHTAGTLTGQGVLEGKELLVMDNGVYAVDPAHGRAYYVNTTVDYGPQAAGSAYANADSLVLNRDGAVLNLQSGLSAAAANGIKAQVAGGRVNLAQGITLHQNTLTDTANVKIGGAGIYQVQVKTGSSNIDTTLGAANNVTLADGWTGTVELLGAGGFRSHLVLENYGNSLSTVKLTGNAGWLSSNEFFAVNLLLEDAENRSALTIVNGGIGGTETFNGSVSGSGSMEMAWDSTLDFKFNGDLSGWTGGFKTTSGTANVFLLGNVTDVAAAIQATSLTVGTNVTFHNTVKAGSLTATGSVIVGDSGTLDLTGLTSSAKLETLTLEAGSTTVLNKTNMLTATGTLAVADGASLDLTGLSVSGDPQSYVLATGGNVTLGVSVSFTLADEALLERASLGVVNGTSLVLTLAPATQNLVWQGPNGQWTTDAAQMPWYKEGTQTAATFRNGDSVRFGAASNTHTATLGADINATALAVDENAAVTLALNSHALTTETLTVDSGSTLTVNGSGKVMEAAASTIGGAVVLGAGTTLKLNGAESSFTLGKVSLNNGAKLDVAAAGTVTAESVFVKDGSAAEISLAQDMSITAGTSADSKAGALYTMGATKTLSIHSADAGSIKTLTVDRLDIANNNTAISLQNVTLDVLGAATVGVLITDRSNDVGSVTVGGGAVLNFNGSVDWHKAGSSDVVNLTVQDGGAAHVNNGAANTLNNVTVQDGGSLTFAAGTSTALYGTLSLAEQIANGGTLDFGGRNVAVALGGDDAATTFSITPEGYTSISGVKGDNGFYHTMAGDITSGSGSVANGGSVAVTFNGATVTGLNADGTFGTVDNTTYHVRSGSVDYADIAGVSSITTVAVSNNASLNLNTALAANVGIASTGGTVNIGSGVTLQASSLSATSTTLTGEGTYALAPNGKNLGSNLVLAADWTGRVAMSGTGMTAIVLNYSNPGAANALATALSSIELRGVQGWLNSTASNNAKLILTNPDGNTSALKLTDGSSTSVTYFQGDISGTGDLESAWNKAANVRFEMQGNLGSWTGNIVKSAGSESTFTLKENPGSSIAVGALAKAGKLNIIVSHSSPVTLSGTFAQNGGTLNMTVDAGTQAAFSGNITSVNSFTLGEGAGASFSGTNSLTNVAMADGSSLSIAGGTTSVSGTGTLKDITVLDGGALSFAAGSSTALYDPISLEEQISNAGTLDFGGRAVAISLGGDDAAATFAITPEGYTDIHGLEGNNGFRHTLGGTAIANSASGSIVGFGNVKVSYAGIDYALHENGTFSSVDDTIYYVRSGEVNYSDIAATATVGTVSLEGGTLNLNASLAGTVTHGIQSRGGTVNIGSGVTLQASSLSATATTTLVGAGTYALADGKTALENVRLGDSWLGTVRVSSATATGLDFSTLADDSLSTIELNGYIGWSNQWKNGTNAENIRLTNPDAVTYAWTNRADTTSEGFATTFTGTWSGMGTFAVAPRALGYTFKGDIAEWTGAMVNIDNRAYTSILTFAENAGVVKAAISDNATAKFAVAVKTDAVFSNNVEVHGGLTIDGGCTAMFTSSAGFASLAGAGNLVVDSGSNTVTFSGGSNSSGTIAVRSGTLDLKGGVISKAITQSGGTLVLDGTFDVNGLSVVGDPIVYYTGAEDFTHRNNGVRGSWLDLQLRTADSTGTLSIADASRFTYNGMTMTGRAGEAGVINLQSEGFSSTFYINDASERTGWIFRADADYPATDISIARGATLVVDDNAGAGFSAGKIQVQDGTGYANLQIGGGNKVIADTTDRALQLSGAGTYKLLGTLGLGSLSTAETTADTPWTGSLDATGIGSDKDKLYALYTSAAIHGGTVLLKSVQGDPTSGADTECLTMQLAGDSTMAGDHTFAKTTFKTENGGNLRIADWKTSHTWIVGEGTAFDVDGAMRVDNLQSLSIQGGSVTTGDKVVLGHTGSANASGLSMSSGSLKTDAIQVIIGGTGNPAPISITGGTLEFTSATALQLNNNSAATVTLGGTGGDFVTLKADSTSWTLAHNGMNIGNIIAETSGDNTITLGAAGMSANYTGKIRVAEGSHLVLNGAASIQQAIRNDGTLTLGSNLATTGLELHEQQDVNVQLDGTVTLAADANYFTGVKADYIVLAEGCGTVAPNNHTLTKGDKEYAIQTNGLAVGNISGNFINFCQHEEGSTLNASDIAKKAAFMFSVDVQNATLNVDAAIATTTANNARLLVQDPDDFLFGCVITGGTNEIVLQGGKTLDMPNIRFGENASEKVLQLKHADGSDYQVTDNTNAQVRISSLQEDTLRQGRVTITAAAGAPASFNISADSFNVDATRLEKVAGGNVTVNNTLSVREVRNAEPGKDGDFILTQSVDAHALKSVIAANGNIEFRNMSSTECAMLENLEIGAGKAVGFHSGGIADAAHEVSVTVVGTLTAGKDAALNADLVMESGSTLDVRGTGGAGLLMGSTVTLGTDMTLNDYSADWATWKDGTTYVLFTGVDGLSIGNEVTTGTMDYTQWVDAKEYFSNIEESNRYFLCYGGAPDQDAVGVLTAVNDGSNVGMVYIMTMPEPTTSTLSLLALAALAARRRRR